MTESVQIVIMAEKVKRCAYKKKKIYTVIISALYALVVVRQVNGKRFELKECGDHIACASKKVADIKK